MEDDKKVRDEFEELVSSVLEEDKIAVAAPAERPVRTSSGSGKSIVKQPATGDAPKSGAKKKKKKKKKKKSAARIIGNIVKTIFLIALLACLCAIGLGIYMFLGFNNDSLETDSVSKLIKTEGLSVDERFDVNASAQTAVVKLDKADIWYMVENQLGEDFIEEYKENFNEKGLRLSAYGIIIDEDGCGIELDVRWNSIKIPCHLPAELTYEKGTLTLTPQSLRLLRFDISPKLLKMFTKMDLSDKKFELKMEPSGIIKSWDSMSVKGQELVFNCTLDGSMLGLISPESGYPEYICRYCEGYSEIIQAAEEYDEMPVEALKTFLKPAEGGDGQFERLLSEYYTLVSTQDAWDKLGSSHDFILDRVLFGYSKESFIDANGRLAEFCTKRQDMIDSLANGLYDAWIGSKITLDKSGEFIYKKEALAMSSFATEEDPWDNYLLFMDGESFNYVIVNDMNAYVEKTPALKKLTGKNVIFSEEEFDTAASYQIGFTAETVNGHYFLCYMGSEMVPAEEEGAEAVLALKPIYLSLTEAEYKSLISTSEEEPLIMVWTGEVPEVTEGE